MKFPKNYLNKFNKIDTQFYFFLIKQKLLEKLEYKMNIIKWNLPTFDEFNLFQKVKREITFDTINDFNVYKLLNEHDSRARDILDNQIPNSFDGFYNTFKSIERDKKVDNILEIETEYIEIYLKNINKKSNIKKIFEIFYSLIFEIYQEIQNEDKIKFKLEYPRFNLNLPLEIKKIDETKNTNFIFDIEKDQFLKEFLRENGLVYFFPKNNQFFKHNLLAISKNSGKILDIATFKFLDKLSFGNEAGNQNEDLSKKYKIKINYYNLILFFLEKYSVFELF